MKSERLNILIYGANIVFLLFALCVLLWLQGRFENDLQSTRQETAALFSRSILGGPDNRNVAFRQWEERVGVAERSQFISRIYLSKIVNEGGQRREIAIQPFWFAAQHGRRMPDEVFEDLEAMPLSDADGQYGVIYFGLDLSPLQTVQLAIWTLAVLLTLALVVLTTRLWSQERALTKTTVELEEKTRQLVRLERLALAGQLTSNIFHDMRKPILNIRHELDDLGETLGNFAGASKGLLHIREQVDLFFAMLRELNLERFVSAKDEESEYVEVSKVVEQACRLVQYERRAVSLEINAAPGLPLVLAPPYRLIQVFSNLALNAYQAMNGRGELRITMRREDGAVRVEFSDTGPGIAPMNLPYIFMPFFSTKGDEQGTGLGLYISRQIIEELGGEIRVHSNDSIGSTFTVTLPAATAG